MKEAACRRAVAALAIVAALVFAVPAIDAVSNAADKGANAPDEHAGLDAGMMADGSAQEALSRFEKAAEPSSAVPDWFQAEVGALPGARDVRVAGNVTGYVVDEEESCALEALLAHMAARGWTAVPLGGVSGATFLKESGSCTWALATCTQVGNATCIVIRCNRK